MIFEDSISYFFFIFIFNFLLLAKINWIAKKINVYDEPDNSRKIHHTSTPLLGGFIIFVNFLAFSLFFFIFDINVLIDSFRISEVMTVIFFLIICSIIFLIGFYDDTYSISSKTRLLILSLIVYFFIYVVDISQINSLNFLSIQETLELKKLKILFPSFCILILMISCNLYDGINFQSFLFYMINFCFLYYLNQNSFILMIIISLLFFGFLNFNGKVFLGESGVYLLSFILGYCFIICFNYQFKLIYADQIFLFLLFPVLDSIRVFVLRLIKNKNIFTPDQSHFHHIIIKKVGYLKSVFILLFFNLIPIFSYFYSLNPAIISILFILLYSSILFFSKTIKI